ncbi:UNVERIFIED_CONTAM: hypothetical protein PYX00_011405 [Menopon gallinae]|uniref:GP-PDE domain-containing protein n=1 Tax=Menopon gallinae TaxID=328185 RepID=A0AAW2H7M4_9NEOP
MKGKSEAETRIVGILLDASHQGLSNAIEVDVAVGRGGDASSLERHPMIKLVNCFFAFVAIDKLFEYHIAVDTGLGMQMIEVEDAMLEHVHLSARRCRLPDGEVHLIRHRGSGENSTHLEDDYVENTEFAIRDGVARGAGWVEIDVHLTGDGIPIVHHDFSIECNGSKRLLSSLTYEEVVDAHFLAFNPKRRWSLRLLTLKDALVVAGNAGVNVEIKYPLSKDLKEMPEYAYVHPRNSFHPQIVLALSAVTHSHPIFFLTEGDGGNHRETICNVMDLAIRFALRLGISGVVMDSKHLFSSITNFEAISERTGLQFLAYGKKLNDLVMARIAVARGICGVITDSADVIAGLNDIFNAWRTSPFVGMKKKENFKK